MFLAVFLKTYLTGFHGLSPFGELFNYSVSLGSPIAVVILFKGVNTLASLSSHWAPTSARVHTGVSAQKHAEQEFWLGSLSVLTVELTWRRTVPALNSRRGGEIRNPRGSSTWAKLKFLIRGLPALSKSFCRNHFESPCICVSAAECKAD